MPLEDVPGFAARAAACRPGLTGIAQIYAPRDIPRRHKFRYDRLYVRRQSIWLDLRLIVAVVLDHRAGHVGSARQEVLIYTPSSMHDVVVVGGGPGGLHAARRLASRGVDVTVLEEHGHCGAPVHCTGILARDAFDEFGLSRASILNEVTTARFVSPRGTDVVHRTRAVEAVVIDRARFDQELALRRHAVWRDRATGDAGARRGHRR